jgi:putative membrane protein
MYEGVLAFHIISFVSWMAALFYLPRLFVYHQENNQKKEFLSVMKVMEFKLFKYIGVPAMWATILSGGFMLYSNPALLQGSGWMHAKLLMVFFLVIYFIHLGKLLKALEEDRCTKSGKFFRFYNEVPTLLLIAIVIFVIVKPF